MGDCVIRILNAGDSAVTVEFGQKIDPEVCGMIQTFCKKLQQEPIRGITEVLPTFRSLTVFYDPMIISYNKLVRSLKKKSASLSALEQTDKRIYEIPVCYEEPFCPDLAFVAEHAKMTPEAVIERHSAPDYLIYMLGFLPGFAYLGGLDESIVTPRLSSPRTKIEAGSVGIGGEQTGIYPLDSPGGWQLIGRTPLKPYDPDRKQKILYEAGDYIHFNPISYEEYQRIEAEVKAGTYQVSVRVVEAGR